MKIKINPFYIICVIIAELIMINFLFVFIFIRNSHTDSLDNKAAQTVVTPKQPLSVKNKKTTGNTIKKDISHKQRTEKEQTVKVSPLKSEKGILVLHDRIIDQILNIGSSDYANRLFLSHNYLLIEKEDFIATAYDLSYQSCGKYPGDPAYGITYSGTKAVKGRTIAVDPKVIPLGSKVYVEFPEEYGNMDGWYIAEDTGNKIKGKIIDVYFGKSALKEAMQFGRRRVKLKIQVEVQ